MKTCDKEMKRMANSKPANRQRSLLLLLATASLMILLIVSGVSAVENVVEEKIVHVKQDRVPHHPQEGDSNSEVVEDIVDGNNLVFAPECDPKCKSTEFCNFAGECEPFPILIMECEVGSSCDRCHCSGSCVDGVCHSK